MLAAATVLLFLASTITFTSGSQFFIGNQGQSCYEVCNDQKMNCNPHIPTNNSAAIFAQLGIQCTADTRSWWAEDQPCYVSGQNDPNYGHCLGYTNLPDGVLCSGSYAASRRLCYCDNPNQLSKVAAFGTGLSAGQITTDEQVIFNHVMPDGVYGVMTHFWATAGNGILEHSVVRYYIDGETTPSIEFVPPLACGSAVDMTDAPWGTKWFGKGAKDGSWFHNFRIPFQRTVKVTVQSTNGNYGGFYIIVRGTPNLPLRIGDFPIPSTARLILQKIEKQVQPLEWVNVIDVPAGKSGLFFLHTLYVTSNNLNFLEGCYHTYTQGQTFPGTVIATGTEDYFDSGWYFNAGGFHFPVSGMTKLTTSPNSATVSAYRFHEQDPMPFDDGFQFVWRNGDTVDAAGRKCFTQKGGTVGSPGVSNVVTYGWVYVW